MGERAVVITVKGNAFLHSMVRTIVGTLVMVGRGQRKPEWVADVLRRATDAPLGENAPAAGLVFWNVLRRRKGPSRSGAKDTFFMVSVSTSRSAMVFPALGKPTSSRLRAGMRTSSRKRLFRNLRMRLLPIRVMRISRRAVATAELA